MFIKLKDQIVKKDSILKVDAPRKYGVGIEWTIRTLMESKDEPVINSVYSSEEEAKSDYDRIVKQLCADKD